MGSTDARGRHAARPTRRRWPALLLATALIGGLLSVGGPAVADTGGVVVRIGMSSALEPESGSRGLFVPVFLSMPSSEPTTVSFHTVAYDAQPGLDYTQWGTADRPRSITIPAGALQGTINVPVLADDGPEAATERFAVQVDAVSSNATIGEPLGLGTIYDVDRYDTTNPVLLVSGGTVWEGDLGTRRAQFFVHLSRPATGNVTISYRTLDASATAPDDYTSKLPGSTTLVTGQLSKTIDVVVPSNTTPNTSGVPNNERFFLLDVTVVGGSPVESIGTLQSMFVYDDDIVADTTPPVLTLPDSMQVEATGPSGATVTYQATATDDVDGPVPVSCFRESGTGFPLGSNTVDCSATDAAGNQALGSFTVEVRDTTPPVLTTEDLTVAAVTSGGTRLAYYASGEDLVSGAVPAQCSPGGGLFPVGTTTVNCTLSDGAGNTGTGSFTVTVDASTLAWSEVSAGTEFACATTTTTGVKCWGYGGQWQLGNPAVYPRSATPVDLGGVPPLTTAVSAGSAHACRTQVGGGVLCWGSNQFGQLGRGGIGGSSPASIPPVGLTSGVSSLSSGLSHTCAVTAAGGVRCWGANDHGQLGNGTTAPSGVPVDVSGLTSGVTQVSASSSTTCALLSDGSVRCWGMGLLGQLGNGADVDSLVPVDVTGLGAGSTTALAAGSTSDHVCAVTTAGGAVCWGRNSFGELGNGAVGNSNVPVPVSGLGSGVSRLAVGLVHSCAVTDDGALRCWGRNADGRLGDGTTEDRFLPTDVVGLGSGVTSVAAGSNSTCAVAGGSLKCWGTGDQGQLGNGGFTGSLLPVDVAGP